MQCSDLRCSSKDTALLSKDDRSKPEDIYKLIDKQVANNSFARCVCVSHLKCLKQT